MISMIKFIVDIPIDYDENSGTHPALYSQSMELIRTADKLGGRAVFVGYKTPERFVKSDMLPPYLFKGIDNIENNELTKG